MDLREFYFQNIQESEYHHRFCDTIKDVNKIYNVFDEYQEVDDYEFEIYDEEEAITKFKELCQPEKSFSDSESKCWFYLITYYLYNSHVQNSKNTEFMLFYGCGKSVLSL